jgi:hypothetical protein
MTVQCCECGKRTGEKCPRCGTLAPEFFEIHECRKCRLAFRMGEGGVSHGICTFCFKKQMAELEALYGPEVKQLVRPMGLSAPASRDCRGCIHDDCGFCTARSTVRESCEEWVKGAA